MTFVIAGLGNPGEKYARTRHNAGRMVVADFVKKHGGEFHASKKYVSLEWGGEIGKEEVIALLPETFMNESGGAVKKAVKSKKDAGRLVVVYDDIDLPLGTVRIAFDRSAGGHNGLKSIIGAIKTEAFVRIRIGISAMARGKVKKPQGEKEVVQWVMGEFKKPEEKIFVEVSARVGEILEHILEEGTQSAMNTFNGA